MIGVGRPGGSSGLAGPPAAGALKTPSPRQEQDPGPVGGPAGMRLDARGVVGELDAPAAGDRTDVDPHVAMVVPLE